MKKLLAWIKSLFVSLFARPAAVSSAPGIELPSVSIKDSRVTRIPVIMRPIHRRQRMSAIIEHVTLPEVSFQPLSRHRILIDDGSVQKVLGQISESGFARIRPFGRPLASHRAVKLRNDRLAAA